MEWVQLPVIQLGALGVLLGVLWLVFTGRLVPRSVVTDIRKDRDDRLAASEKDAERGWALYETERSSHETTRTALASQAQAATAAIAAARTTEHLLVELKESATPGATA